MELPTVAIGDLIAGLALLLSLGNIAYVVWRDRPRPRVVARWPEKSVRPNIILENRGTGTAYNVNATIRTLDAAQVHGDGPWMTMLPVRRMDPGTTYGLPIFVTSENLMYEVAVSWERKDGGQPVDVAYPLSVIRDTAHD